MVCFNYRSTLIFHKLLVWQASFFLWLFMFSYVIFPTLLFDFLGHFLKKNHRFDINDDFGEEFAHGTYPDLPAVVSS